MTVPPIHLLEALASLSEQRRYVIGATKDEYLLPEELLGDAWQFCEQVAHSDAWVKLTLDQRRAVERLKQAVDATSIEGYDHISDLIERDPAWAEARQQASNVLHSFGRGRPD